MLHYQLFIENPVEHFITFHGSFSTPEQTIFLQLASWRPGRYELMNYAKNIRGFQAFDRNGNELCVKKSSKNCWQIDTSNCTHVHIQYQYYAFEMDAGKTYLDENQLYVNFINCIPALVSREDEAIQLTLNLPDDYQIACGLQEIETHLLAADNYDELVDCPMIASNSLQHEKYELNNKTFHIWFQGKYTPNWTKILADFTRFSEENIKVFGEFPCQDYHFLVQILPYRYYHGVEHRNSTVIVLGQDQQNPIDFYDDFLGISCHELFHTWNICRIRPKEMMPYDYTKENYFETGYIAEGITTYYGDYLLARSHVFTTEQYFEEINTLFQRHFHNFGRFNASLAESSYDLWVDGYEQGIPNRKVSIYVKGALIALLLDLLIRKETKNSKSLDNLMRLMWTRFGKRKVGYTTQDYELCIYQVTENHDFAKKYIQEYVYGKNPLEKPLNEALSYIGCELSIEENLNFHEAWLGFKIRNDKNRWIVYQIAPDSPASTVLSLQDEIIAVNQLPFYGVFLPNTTHELDIIRNHENIKRAISPAEKTFFPEYSIKKQENSNEEVMQNFNLWLNQSFE